MAYNYLELVNRLLRQTNEVELTAGTFASASKIHAMAKDSINHAISDIYREVQGKWPFARATTTQTLTVPSSRPYIQEYSVPATAESVDWNSFRIQYTTSPSQEQMRLKLISYDQYNKWYRDNDANSNTSSFGLPKFIVNLTDRDWTVSTIPDKAYIIEYEYFTYYIRLDVYSDVPAIPEAHEQVILDRALHYMYMFRDNIELAAVVQQRYEDGLLNMRRSLMPLPNSARFYI